MTSTQLTQSTSDFKNSAITTDGQRDMHNAYSPVLNNDIATKNTVQRPRAHEESGSNFTPDMDYNNYFKYTLTGATTINIPVNHQPGHKGTFELIQDAAGYGIAFAEGYHFLGALQNLSTTSGAVMIIEYTIIDSDTIVLNSRYKTEPFIFTIETTVPNESFSLPLVSGYDYKFRVDWGDNNNDLVDVWNAPEATHTYATAGTHQIIMNGVCETVRFGYHQHAHKLISVQQLGTMRWKTFYQSFGDNKYIGCQNLASFTAGECDTSQITSMNYMFGGCDNLTTVDMSSFNTPNVTNMSRVFWFCPSLASCNVSGWDTSKVTTFEALFLACNSLTTIDVSHFNTSNVTNMSSMFGNCYILTGVDVSNWDTSNVTNMSNLFSNCRVFPTLDVTNFNTSKVTSMSGMFQYCKGLTTVDLTNFDTSSCTSLENFFYNSNNITDIDVTGFNISNVKSLTYFVGNCSSLLSIDVSGFDTSSVTQMRNTFNGCTSLTSLDVSNFDTSSCTIMTGTFQSCSGVTALDVTGFNTSKVTTMNNMFSACSSLSSLDVTNFNTSNVTDMQMMFKSCSALPSIDVTNFDTSSCTTMHGMFQSSIFTTLDLGNFDISMIESFREMFNGSKLTTLDLSAWSRVSFVDKGTWNPSTNTPILADGTGTKGDYYKITATSYRDLGSGNNYWNTNNYMIYTGSKWNESSTAIPGSIFTTKWMMNACSDVTSVKMFDSSGVTDTSYMFQGCSTLTCIDKIDTTASTNKTDMFKSCTILVQPDAAAITDITDADGASWVNGSACP